MCHHNCTYVATVTLAGGSAGCVKYDVAQRSHQRTPTGQSSQQGPHCGPLALYAHRNETSYTKRASWQANPTFTLEPRPTGGEAGSPGAAIPPNTQQPARPCQACALVDAARSGAKKIPHVVEWSVVCCFSTGVPDVLLASRPCFLIYCVQYMLMILYTVQHM